MTSKVADAVLEGLALRKEMAPEEEELYTAEDEKYLSADTLARLREIQFAEKDEAGDVDEDEDYDDEDYDDEDYDDEEDDEEYD
jgi:hypothetical protein